MLYFLATALLLWPDPSFVSIDYISSIQTIGEPVPVVAIAPPDPPYIENERLYLPVLDDVLDRYWPDIPDRSWVAAQIRQETCYSLRHSKCWSPNAELKTEREYGFGLGQLTITEKFNNFIEAKKLDSSLSSWKWEDRYNPEYQIRTMVLMLKFNYGKFSWASSEKERMAFSFAAYNGGMGGVLSDRRVCMAEDWCDPSIWFYHVEKTSRKSKKPVKGYSKSFFQINREYVRNIMIKYPDRYRYYFYNETENVFYYEGKNSGVFICRRYFYYPDNRVTLL